MTRDRAAGGTGDAEVVDLSGPRQPAPRTPSPQRMREIMGLFATGVTVVSVGGPRPHAMTANAFSSVSLEPPMVLCCVARTARMHDAVLAAGCFAVSVLAEDQHAVAGHFASRSRPSGRAQFAEVAHRLGPHTGAPLLTGALAWLELSLAHSYPGGDHTILVGEVLDCGERVGAEDPAALAFYAGRFHRLDPTGELPSQRAKDAS